MTSDTSLWMKFLLESDLTADQNTLLQYSTALSKRFKTIDKLLRVDENELTDLGITNQYDRNCLIRQAHLLDDKENLPLIRQSTISNYANEHWLSNNQSTPVDPQSKCNLSPALLSRISFNDHASCDEVTLINPNISSEHFYTPKRVDHNEKLQTLIESGQQLTSPTSTRGMRMIKSISNSIALQKKVLVGNDRLKRLTLPRSLIKRQTALLTQKVSNLTNKLINPFAKKNNKNDLKLHGNTDKQNREVKECNEYQKVEVSDRNNLLTHLAEIESKRTVSSTQTFPSRKFKLGAPTKFLTRSLANHGVKE
ncbi:hypothetical protein I4U23_019569 [Adineta vaga]|nr:hypothetical protein I4U23_019569 [Adineta vaga]